MRKEEHKSDIYRLFVLYTFGGIYLDDDLVMLKSHSEFLGENRLVIAEESSASLANGFMMAPKGCKILLKWLQEYKYSRDVRNLKFQIFTEFNLFEISLFSADFGTFDLIIFF